jgi:hypothetical protein
MTRCFFRVLDPAASLTLTLHGPSGNSPGIQRVGMGGGKGERWMGRGWSRKGAVGTKAAPFDLRGENYIDKLQVPKKRERIAKRTWLYRESSSSYLM